MAKDKKRARENTDARHLSFRLDDESASELDRMAQEAGTSPSLYARDLVVAAMTGQDDQRQELRLIRHEVAVLSEVLRKLRGDLASSMNLLLVQAGGLQPAEAQEWVTRTLLES